MLSTSPLEQENYNMYDMEHCDKCKDKAKEYSSLSSRISSMKYHEEDYDRMKGKGKFKKEHADSKKMMHDMMDKKTKMITEHMGHDLPTEKSLEDKAGPISVGVYHG